MVQHNCHRATLCGDDGSKAIMLDHRSNAILIGRRPVNLHASQEVDTIPNWLDF